MLDESLGDLLERLGKVKRLCRSLGLERIFELSRFAEYARRIERTFELFKAAEGEARQRAEEYFLAEGLLGYGVALTETTELAEALPWLESCGESAVRQKLKDVLSGPRFPGDESSTSNHARNTLFELNIATRLWRAGLGPRLGTRPDLWCEIGGKHLLFECKRPFGTRSVGSNIKEARHQILDALKHEPAGSRGVIAVSVTRLVSTGDRYFIASNQESASRGLRDQLAEIAAGSRSVWTKLGDRVVGILFHAITLVQLLDQGAYVTAQVTNMQNLGRLGSLNYQVFNELYRLLNAAAY